MAKRSNKPQIPDLFNQNPVQTLIPDAKKQVNQIPEVSNKENIIIEEDGTRNNIRFEEKIERAPINYVEIEEPKKKDFKPETDINICEVEVLINKTITYIIPAISHRRTEWDYNKNKYFVAQLRPYIRILQNKDTFKIVAVKKIKYLGEYSGPEEK